MYHTKEETRFFVDVDAESEEEAQLMWDRIREGLRNLDVEFPRLKIFVDGFVKGTKRTFLSDGGPTAKTAKELVDQGATLMPTEKLKFLNKFENAETILLFQLSLAEDLELKGTDDYQLWDNILSSVTEVIKNTRLRDMAIAESIDNSLEEDEVGILFMGAGHKVQEHLPPDIKVEPISEEVMALNREFAPRYDFETVLEMAKTTRDSFAPPSRGPERI